MCSGNPKLQMYNYLQGNILSCVLNYLYVHFCTLAKFELYGHH
jgi:Na+-driven multidrug efflux pump